MSQVKSIKCTKCAAPLDLLGGGRVKTITCAYCKSILDIEDEYKVLGNFQNIKFKHEIPFKIGMHGSIKNIDYTIIGRVRYSELHGDSFWDDLLLFSPLYGYAWLTYEEGHITYSKRTRNFPNYSWDDIKNINTLQHNEQQYQADELFISRIDYIEGELTWIAKKYDKNSLLELYAPPHGISIEKSKDEIEYYELEYLDNSEVYKAFNIPIEEQVTHNNIHELREFGTSLFKPLMQMTLGVIAITTLLIFMVLQTDHGKKLFSVLADNTNPIEHPFQLNSAQYLSTIILTSPTDKELDNFNIKILEKNQTVFAINTHNCYISPHLKSTENLYLPTWSYRAKEVKIYLNLQEKVPYTLQVTAVDTNIKSTLKVVINEKEGRINYLVWYLLGLILIIINHFIQKRVYQKQLNDDEYESWMFALFKNSIPFLLVYMIMFFVIVPFQGMPIIIKIFITFLVSIFVYNFIKIPINIVYSIYKKFKGE